MTQLPPNSARVNTARIFQDGDYVFAHSEYDFFGPKIGFDIFRFENGKIVEHWDNLQETPASPNPSGRTMIDGPTEATDLELTEQNKNFVRQFVEDILVNGKLDKLAGYYNGDNYTQHNPQIADGLSGLGQALQAMAEQGITMKYDRFIKCSVKEILSLVLAKEALPDSRLLFMISSASKTGKLPNTGTQSKPSRRRAPGRTRTASSNST